MARIKKDDHARILKLVDIEQRAVREIAAEFGCTPAAIYALLTKLRRETNGVAAAPAEAQPPLALSQEAPASPPEATDIAPPQEERRVVTFERAAQAAPATSPAAARAPAQLREEARRPGPSTASAAPVRAASLGGKLAKPGMGLLMRTPDGEETMTPFRSLDDLLSAIKPILRAGARSPEPVWFSLQPVDLATIDVDAA